METAQWGKFRASDGQHSKLEFISIFHLQIDISDIFSMVKYDRHIPHSARALCEAEMAS